MSKKIWTTLAVSLALGTGAPIGSVAHADPSFPYGDRATAHIADVLKGTHRGGWLATTLDYGCDVTYGGPRHAEEVKIPPGHGRRWVGIIHVSTRSRAKKVRATLECQGVWFAQGSGGRFVVPLRSNYDTDGGTGLTFKQAATWAKRRLGSGWAVR
jgi:hypothetical protein